MATNDSLDLRVLHDQIHGLLLSRRKNIGLWENVFETAWAGYVLARHAPENRQEEILNSIKGELLGAKRITTISKPYDLAAAYMVAVFLHQVGAVQNAQDFIFLAERSITNQTPENFHERFQFFSTPEYIYAVALASEHMPESLSPSSATALKKATSSLRQSNWLSNSYAFALVSSAHLRVNGYATEECLAVMESARNLELHLTEDNIALLWLLDTHWEQMNKNLDDELVKEVDQYLIELRTRVFRFYPNFATEGFDFEQSRSLTDEQQLDRVARQRVVTTIELLMLDEISERHAVSALVVTREEWERREVIVTLFDTYRKPLDEAIDRLGLTNHVQTVYQNFLAGNPASLGQAAFGCRTLLYELADRLFQAPDSQYPYIKSKDGNPMSLAKDREKNRLEAYMHQIGIRSNNPLIVTQLDYMSNLMRQLIDEAAATGKRVTTYDAARSLVLQTYLFLGELLRLTNFQVITAIVPPGQQNLELEKH